MGKIRGAIVIDTERCKGCQLCVGACRFNLITMAKRSVNKKGYSYAEQLDHEPCNGCTNCAIVCPDGCITVYRVKED